MIAVVLVGCGSDGPVADATPATAVTEAAAPDPTDAPPATDAPEPEVTEAPTVTEAPAAPTEPDPNPVVPDEDDGVDLLIALLIIGGLIAAVALIGAAIAKSRTKAPAAATTSAAAPPSPQANLLSTTQWITDQLTLELMAAPPAAALQRWSVERSRLDNVSIGAQQQYLDAQDPNWQPLAETMSALAGSIDTSLALRAQEPPNPQLISDSIDVVNGHRARLHQLVAALLPTIGR